MRFKKLGMRTIKTGIAVGLAIFISQILNIKSPFFAGISAIIAMQSSIYESLESGKQRMYSTILGAVTALIFSFIAPENPLFISIGIIIVIYICNSFRISETIPLASMVFLSIILNYDDSGRINYALYRTLDTFVGLIIGTLVNYFFVPHELEDKVTKNFTDVYYQLKAILEMIVWNRDIELITLRQNLAHAEDEYKISKKEIEYKVYKSKIQFDFSEIFELLESTYVHMSILSSLDGKHKIDHYNKKALEILFKRDIPLKEDDRLASEKDIVYNYHLGLVLNNLSNIAYIFGLKK